MVIIYFTMETGELSRKTFLPTTPTFPSPQAATRVADFHRQVTAHAEPFATRYKKTPSLTKI